ncbi:GGDEF domain-containing protein [Rhizobium sp. AG855]|uniref:GGDEF domain-containing protein n=1 Tax=Rhizobium sp. AG855 TaxID=2183898 RepID=UPI000E737841|nr:GGDEF domain-containing protein [Rhizobium sp. AG855]RKE85220.1 diguanylate cyclase (GGDEF)-like protein [Rhizobium sp. AG855]
MIDVKTGFLLWVIQAGTLAILLIAIWLHGREQRHFLWFGIGFAAHATGLGLVGGRGDIPDFVSIHVANVTSLLAFGCWAGAISALDRRQPPLLAWLPPLVWIGCNLVPEVRDTFYLRVATHNLGATVGFMFLAFLIMRASFSSPRYRQMLAVVWSIQALSSISFCVFVLFDKPRNFQADIIGLWMGTVALIGFITAIIILAKMLMDRSEERLQALVRTDPLTGVLNRRGFTEAYQRLQDAAPLPGIGLLIFDLDHFKQVNDDHGHQVGDMVLQEFSNLCRSLLPQRAAFARTGGEEFAAVLAISEPRDAALFAETVRLALAERVISTEAQDLRITTSVGIAVSPLSRAGLEQLMTDADAALYASKERGRNRTSVKSGSRIMTVPPTGSGKADRDVDGRVDRQVAILKRIAAVATSLDE